MNKTLYILLFLAFAAYGQQQERIAIMHTVDDLDSVGFTDLGYLTDKLRDIAGRILPQERYGIMTQQSIVDRLGSEERAEKECREATCLADLGRKISADYISQGHIGRFSGKLTIKVELYRVRNSILIGSFTGDSKDLEGLMETIKAESPAMFEKMKAHYLESNENLVKSVSDDLEKVTKVETGIKSEGSSSGLPRWVALGLDVLGAGMIGFGIYQNGQAASHKKDYKGIPQDSPQSDFDSAYEKVESSRVMRNTGYIAGGVLLLGGVSVHIFF
jgi:hypothetical protein